MFEKMTIEEYCDVLSSKQPTPGGGSALAVIGATACSLIQMALNVSIESKRDDDSGVFYYLIAIRDNTKRAREAFLKLANADAEAYNRIVEARKLPKTTDEEVKIRTSAMQKAFHKATLVPLELMQLSLDVARKSSARALPRVTKYVKSDCEIGINLLKTVIRTSIDNVYANTAYIRDDTLRNTLEKQAEEIIERIKEI